MSSSPANVTAEHGRKRRWVAAAGAGALVAASAIASTPQAFAASTPDQSGSASILDATVLGAPVGDIVNPLLNPVGTTSSGTTQQTVDGSSLPTIGVGGIDLLGTVSSDSLLSLDSATDTVTLDPTATSSSTSGVADLGIDVAPFLSQVGLDSVFSDLGLNVGALSSTSTQAAGGDPSGSVSLAGVTLDATSPVVGGMTGALATVLGPDGPIQGILDSVTGIISAVPGAPNVSADLSQAVAPLTSQPFTANGVTIDPSTGAVSFDLSQILGSTISDPAPNTELFSSATVDALTTALAAALDSYTTALVNAVTQAVSAVDVTFTPVAGTGLQGTVNVGQLLGLDDTPMDLQACTLGVCLPGAGTLLDVVTAPLQALGDTIPSVVSTAVGGVVTPVVDALSPALGLVDSVLSVTLNQQSQSAPGEPFTTTALSADILGGSVASLNIANATIQAAATPFITSADTVPAGGTTPVDGVGFAPGETVTVQLVDAGGNPVGDPVTVTANPDGTFSSQLPIPADAAPGDYTIQATGPTSGTVTTPITVTPAPTLTAADPSVPAGGTTTLTGTGYTPNADVTVTTTAPDGTTTTQTVTADANGNITFDFPTTASTATGTYTFSAADPSGATGTTTVAVTAAPTVTAPDVAAAGDTAPITGTGYTPGAPVHVVVTDPAGNTVYEGDVTPDANGNISADVPIPSDAAPGQYTVTTTDSTGASATDTFPVASPTLAVGDDSVPAGTSVPITGSGFAPGEDVTVQLLDPSGNPVGNPVTVTADANGNITGTVPVPDDAVAGNYTVQATGNDSGATASDTVAVTNADFTLSDTSVPAGGTTTVNGTGYTPNGDVLVELVAPDGTVVGTFPGTADADGNVTVDVPTGSGLAPGDYTVRVTDQTSGEVEEQPLTITPAPTLTPAQPTVPSGGTTTVTGTGFTPGSDVTVAITAPDGSQTTQTVTADATGAITFDVATSPTDPAGGTYAITATDVSGATADTTVTTSGAPTVTAPTTANGLAGGDLPISGSGYTPNSTVTVDLLDPDGNVVGTVTVTTDANGAFDTTVPLPAGSDGGTYTVQTTDVATGAQATDTVVVVNPSLTPDQSQVPAGGSVDVVGAGFTPGADITVTITGTDGTVTTTTVTADDTGAITIPVATTATTAEGPITIVATDPSGAAPQTTVTVTAALTVTAPPAAPAGGTAPITGTGYTPGEPVHVVVTDPAGTPVYTGDVTPDADGNISVDAPIPAGAAPGQYTVTTTDSSGASATDTFPVADPTLTVGDDSVPAGGTVPITGGGFAPGEDVTVQLTDPSGKPVGNPVTVTADDNGNISGSVPVPSDAAPGDYTVNATGNDSGATASDTVAVTAAPTVDAPAAAAAGDTIPVTGDGYTPGEAVHVVLTDADGNVVWEGDVTAAADGTIAVDIPVPADAAPGQYTVTAVDSSGATATDTVAIANPTLTAGQDQVPAGGSVPITGSGFAPGEPVQVQLQDPAGNPVGDPITLTADANGNISGNLPIPADAPPGDYVVQATGQKSGASAEAPVAVTPAPTIDAPGTASPGDDLRFTGLSFTPKGDVLVDLVDANGTVQGSVTVPADASGHITGTIHLPADLPTGSYTLTATDPSGAVATTSLSVVPACTGPMGGASAESAACPAVATLALTGADAVLPIGIAALALIAAGAVAMVVRKRRGNA